MPSRTEGTIGGAASGAAIGTAILPGWGTAAGGVIGGIAGYFGSGGGDDPDPNKSRWTDGPQLSEQYRRGAEQAMYRGSPYMTGRTQLGQTNLGRVALGSAAQLDPRQQAQMREAQMAQANRLGAIASGQQRGAGELAVGRQMQQAAAQQQATARMQRGMSGASAARGAARNLAGLGVAGAGQAQQAALSDQMGAGQQLAGLLGQTREQDLGMAAQNAQLDQQQMLQQGSMNQQSMLQQGTFDQQRNMQLGQMQQARQLANLDAELRTMGMNDQARLAYLQQWGQMNQSEMAGRLGQEQTAMNQPGITGPMMQAGGQILAAYAANQGGGQAASDERVKTDIRHGGDAVDELLDKLKPSTYAYKPGGKLKQHMGGVGDGRTLAGILAQDLERSTAGKAIVHDTPEGKTVDVVGGLSALFASVARLNERDRAREAKR
jgi:hypothetical protein